MASSILRSLARPLSRSSPNIPAVCTCLVSPASAKVLQPQTTQQIVPGRGYKKHEKGFRREMYAKRCEVGPEPTRRRADWLNWNYDSEIFAFGARLGEEFDEAALRQAFVDSSYVAMESARRAELGLDTATLPPLEMEDNAQLAQHGEHLMTTYVKAYLRNVFPYMFEECVSAVHDHLMSEASLAQVACDLGCDDLLLCQELPPLPPATLSTALKAVVAALERSQGSERAHAFIRDFVLARLSGCDLASLWAPHRAMALLAALLHMAGKPAPEPRLLWSSGASTLMPLYWVGLYSDRQLIAKAPGESPSIAEHQAALAGVRSVMRLADSPPLPLGPAAQGLTLDYDRLNHSAHAILENHYRNPRQEAEGQ